MDAFEFREVAASDTAMMERICRLRVRAWAVVLPQAGLRGKRPDRLDPVARHWVVLHEDVPIAAARLTVHQAIPDLPARQSYPDAITEPLPAPIAALSRLVVDRSRWGLGLSRHLDRVRLDAAGAMGCSCAVAATLGGRGRLRQLERLGFRVVGRGDPMPVTGGRGPEPVVLVCDLVPVPVRRTLSAPHPEWALTAELVAH